MNMLKLMKELEQLQAERDKYREALGEILHECYGAKPTPRKWFIVNIAQKALDDK